MLFWNGGQATFINPNKSEGSYDQTGKYAVWPLSVICQSIVDGCRIYPNEFRPMLKPAFDVLDRYYCPKLQAYTAAQYFEGNDDIYLDDNAQVASALLTAFEVTGDPMYLEKGRRNVQFLMTGFERTGNPGGVRWHISKNVFNTCTTAECGLAALRLAKFVNHDPRPYIDFAVACCRWIFDRLQDPEDKLIWDGFDPRPDNPNEYQVTQHKWTYNQGTPLSLCCMLYYFTRDEWYKNKAEELAMAVTDRNTAIFDRDTPNMEARHYRDSVFFYQLLAEGFADFMLYLGDKSPEHVVNRVREESLHTLKYVHKYLKDPADGLYFQTFELFRINEHTYEAFKALTGENKPYEPAATERENVEVSIAVEQRPLTKSLISCASAARIFFQTARIWPNIEIE